MIHADPRQDNNPEKRFNNRSLLAADAAAHSLAASKTDTDSGGPTPTQYISGDLHASRTYHCWLEAGRAASHKNDRPKQP